MSSKFDQFQAWTVELAALDQLKKVLYFKTVQNILMTCWLSGERSLPFGLLVLFSYMESFLFEQLFEADSLCDFQP